MQPLRNNSRRHCNHSYHLFRRCRSAMLQALRTELLSFNNYHRKTYSSTRRLGSSTLRRTTINNHRLHHRRHYHNSSSNNHNNNCKSINCYSLSHPSSLQLTQPHRYCSTQRNQWAVRKHSLATCWKSYDLAFAVFLNCTIHYRRSKWRTRLLTLFCSRTCRTKRNFKKSNMYDS